MKEDLKHFKWAHRACLWVDAMKGVLLKKTMCQGKASFPVAINSVHLISCKLKSAIAPLNSPVCGLYEIDFIFTKQRRK